MQFPTGGTAHEPQGMIPVSYTHLDVYKRQNGDSMEPTYYDGDKVFVRKTTLIPIGGIGIFTRGNECFIKELGVNCLISHNKKYNDIPANDEIRLVGEVLGKVVEG